MIDYIAKRPMLLCGILCIFISIFSFYFNVLLLLSALAVIFLLFFTVSKKKSAVYILVLLLLGILILNIFLTFTTISKIKSVTGQSERITATVCSVRQKELNYTTAVLEVQNSKLLKKGTKILSFCNSKSISVGDGIKADFKLEYLENGFNNSNLSEEIYLKANVTNIEHTKNDDFLLKKTQKINDYIRKTLFVRMDYESASTLTALILGDRSFFTDEFYQNIKKSGVSHVMVVSGLHLSILVSFITEISQRFIKNRYLKAIIIILVVLFLTVICGFTMSIKRAGITYILMAVAILLDRQSTPENTLGAAVTIILLSSPFAIFSVALQLSLLSTFGILVVALPVIEYVEENSLIKNGFLLGLFKAVIISLSATVMTLPIVIYVFGLVSLVSVFTNLLITLAVTAALWVTVTALVINLVSVYLAEPLFILGNVISRYIGFVINKLGSLKYAAVEVSENVAFIPLVLIIMIFWILIACKKHINMIKLKKKREKIVREGGARLKWR